MALVVLIVLVVETLARAVVALAVFAGAILARTVVPGTLVARTILEAVTGALVALALAVIVAAIVGGAFGNLGGFFGLGLKVDLVGRIGVLADDVADGAIGLDGAQDAEIVLGVLQVVLGQNPVAGRRRVAGQLLVLLVDALGRAAHLDAFGAVRIEGPVGVVLLRLAAGIAATAIVAAALALHALEISHGLSEPVRRSVSADTAGLAGLLNGIGPVGPFKVLETLVSVESPPWLWRGDRLWTVRACRRSFTTVMDDRCSRHPAFWKETSLV